MRAIELLMEEHRIIERNLHVMEVWANGARHNPGPGEREALAKHVSFLREFVDRRHHGKEEDILFVVMMEHGFSREQSPVWLMLHEHDLSRSMIDTLSNLTVQPTPWSEEDRRQLEQTVCAYAALMRDHIQKEDQVLYPLAQRLLPGPAKREISMRVLVAHLFDDLVPPGVVP